MEFANPEVNQLLDGCQGQGMDPHYLGFFECFNRQLFFESHEVLERLWLPSRGGGKADFYRGLIQLAGAFVHLQKDRKGPARALFLKAQRNLIRYPRVYERLEVSLVLEAISRWLTRLESSDSAAELLNDDSAPRIQLISE